jgi:PhnB protein
MAVKPIPEGFHTVTPYLVVKGVAKVLDFVKHAFDAKEIDRHTRPDGAIMHAQVKIGDSFVMLGEPMDGQPLSPSSLYVYVPNVDEVYKRAVKAGGTSLSEPADMFYGDRHGGVKDPAGNQWWIATHIEDVSPEEMQRRSEKFMTEMAKKK